MGSRRLAAGDLTPYSIEAGRAAAMTDTGDPALSSLRDLRDTIDNIDAAIVHMLAEPARWQPKPESCAMSRSSLRRGSTCSEFIYAFRLDHAARRAQQLALLGAGQPLGAIADACGFRDYVHFARGFRHRFGYSPSAHPGGNGRTHGTVRSSTGKSASLAHDV